MKTRKADLSEKLEDAKRGREDENGERGAKLARLSELKREKESLEKELLKAKENDPQALADLEKELKFVVEGANRWTDNIFMCKSYLVKKRGMSSAEAYKILGINQDFDCKMFILTDLCIPVNILSFFILSFLFV